MSADLKAAGPLEPLSAFMTGVAGEVDLLLSGRSTADGEAAEEYNGETQSARDLSCVQAHACQFLQKRLDASVVGRLDLGQGYAPRRLREQANTELRLQPTFF